MSVGSVTPLQADSARGCSKFIPSQMSFLLVVKVLVEAKADPKIPNSDGKTPFHIASENGHSQVVKHLLNTNVNPSIPTIDGATPLYSASEECNKNVVTKLLEVDSKKGHSRIIFAP